MAGIAKSFKRHNIHETKLTNAALSTLEICAGGGGQAIGLEQAGFRCDGLLDNDRHCCATLRANWADARVIEQELSLFVDQEAKSFRGIDLLAGGLPCPPFSIAGKQFGERDERNLFPVTLDLIDATRPRAVMIENVRGILGAGFQDFRQQLSGRLKKMGYFSEWQLLNSSDFGVPQLRPRAVLIALKRDIANHFAWPSSNGRVPQTVGETLIDLMSERGWKGAERWKAQANTIAPTIVGGSHKHGGPDLGPTRAKRAWAKLGVDGMGIANEAPERNFVGNPRLTVRMVARLQGFPDEWQFSGGKTAAYRQVGNAFPPPVARAVATGIAACLRVRKSINVMKAVG